MYENVTREVLLKRMLARVPDRFDKREGSVIYDALAPAAGELQMLYLELDRVLRESFADTQSRDFLILRGAERGVVPRAASAAIRKGRFNKDVPLGTRFSRNSLTYAVFERMEPGVFKLACETPGGAGNGEGGTLLPIDYVEGLTAAVLEEVLVPGADREETEAFRRRYFESLQSQAFGGNVADYKNKAGAMPGVGGVKVIPLWQGAGTVKVILVGADCAPPTPALVTLVQEALDPPQNAGMGVGLAPIGHRCTVAGAEGVPVNLTAALTLAPDFVWGDILPYAVGAIEEYLKSLTAAWGSGTRLVVRVSALESRLLDLPGVVDVGNVRVNGGAGNLTLSESQIPVRGALNVTTIA